MKRRRRVVQRSIDDEEIYSPQTDIGHRKRRVAITRRLCAIPVKMYVRIVSSFKNVTRTAPSPNCAQKSNFLSIVSLLCISYLLNFNLRILLTLSFILSSDNVPSLTADTMALCALSKLKGISNISAPASTAFTTVS